MEISEVVDRESLKAYLDALPKDELRPVTLRVAVHAAARVLPIAARDFLIIDWARKRDVTPIAFFGALSISGFALLALHPEFAHAAADAADAAAKFDIWHLIRADLANDSHALWPEGVPPEMAQIWAEAKTAMQAHPADWSFWIAWYERVLNGRDWHPEAVGAILINLRKEDWEKGPTHINPVFDDVLALYQAEGEAVPKNGETTLTKGHPDQIAQTQTAFNANRGQLPPTLEKVLGYVSLEIDCLQSKNYQSDNERDEAKHLFKVLLTIHEAVERILALVPKSGEMSDQHAEKAEGRVRLVYTRLKEWPRAKPGAETHNVGLMVDRSIKVASELSSNVCRAAMIGCFVYAAPFLAVSSSTALITGAGLFGGDKLIENAKAAKEIVMGDKP